MPVTEKSQTQADQEQEIKNTQEKENKLTNSLLNSLDLPADEPEKKPDLKEGGKVDTRRPKIEIKEEPEAEEEESEEEKEETDEEEEVVPKSKFEKRLNSEVSKRKILEAKLEELEIKAKQNSTGSQRDRLENMSETELKQLRADARAEYKRTEDPAREKQLDDLLEEIDEVRHTAPQRFEKKQVKAYNSKVGEIISDNPEIDFDKSGSDIKAIAVKIYQKYPDLQKLERGQATALEMAFEHWQQTQKVSNGKSKEKEQKQQLTKLKQKTSLDSGSIKGQSNSASKQKAFEAAKKGGLTEKTKYVMDHLLDVDKLLPPDVK